LKAWVEADAENCLRQRIGIQRLRRAPSYKTNELPDGGFAAVGQSGYFTKEEKTNFLTWGVEMLDSLGAQFEHERDEDSDLLTGALHDTLAAFRPLVRDPAVGEALKTSSDAAAVGEAHLAVS
jgi:hypothetical protein